MAELRITAAPLFPEGTALRTYPDAWWSGPPPVVGDAPRSAPFGGPGFVDNHGFASFDGLEPGARYYIGAQVGGIWRWTTAHTDTSTGTISVGAEVEIAAERDAREVADAAETAARIAADALRAPLVSPVLTGVPKAPTAAPAANSTQIATTAYTDAAVAAGGGLSDAQVKGKIAAGPYAGGVPLAGVVGPTTTSGNYTPNLSGFARVFKVKSSGALAFQLPSNFPAGGGFRVFIEIEVEGDKGITYPFLTGWREGVEPEQDHSSPSSVNTIQAFSDDGVTWYGIGSEGLPNTLVQIATPVNTQTVAWNSTTKKWEAAPLGLGKAEVDAEIAANAFLAGTGTMAMAGAPIGAGYFPLTTSTSKASWAHLFTKINEQATQRQTVQATITGASATLSADSWYSATKDKAVLTMPLGSFLPGAFVAVENATGGELKLKGRFTAGSAEETTIALRGAETVLYVSDAGEVWRPVASYRSLAALEAIISPGAWAGLTLGPKLKEAEGLAVYAHGARLEQLGANVRLRGMLQVSAGEELKPTERLCTLPEGKRPAVKNVWITARTASGVAAFTVDEAGKVLLQSAALAAGAQIGLDGISFSVT